MKSRKKGEIQTTAVAATTDKHKLWLILGIVLAVLLVLAIVFLSPARQTLFGKSVQSDALSTTFEDRASAPTTAPTTQTVCMNLQTLPVIGEDTALNRYYTELRQKSICRSAGCSFRGGTRPAGSRFNSDYVYLLTDNRCTGSATSCGAVDIDLYDVGAPRSGTFPNFVLGTSATGQNYETARRDLCRSVRTTPQLLSGSTGCTFTSSSASDDFSATGDGCIAPQTGGGIGGGDIGDIGDIECPSSGCPDRNSCTGIPANVAVCPGDNTDLNENTAATIVNSCPNNQRKCEYTCSPGYVRSADRLSCTLLSSCMDLTSLTYPPGDSLIIQFAGYRRDVCQSAGCTFNGYDNNRDNDQCVGTATSCPNVALFLGGGVSQENARGNLCRAQGCVFTNGGNYNPDGDICTAPPSGLNCVPIGDVDTYAAGLGVLDANDDLALRYVLEILVTRSSDTCGTAGFPTCDDFGGDGYYICKNGMIYSEAGHTCSSLDCNVVAGYTGYIGTNDLLGDIDTYAAGSGVLDANDDLALRYVLEILVTRSSDTCGTAGFPTCNDFSGDGYYICKNGLIYTEAGHTC